MKHVCTENPTPEQYDRPKAVLPSLQCISLDPMHICYKSSRSQGKQQCPARFDFKRLMSKLAVQLAPGHTSCNYVAEHSNMRAPSNYTALLLLIRDQSMEAAEASALISTLRSGDELLPFKNRQEFLKHVVAFVTVYTKSASRMYSERKTTRCSTRFLIYVS